MFYHAVLIFTICSLFLNWYGRDLGWFVQNLKLNLKQLYRLNEVGWHPVVPTVLFLIAKY
jgi:hypothetical protein